MNICEEIAILARRLCWDAVPSEHSAPLFACRLVPLKKSDGGIRPVGIGETLRRIIGKAVTSYNSESIQLASGCIQTCSGLKSGIEAAIHSVRETFEKEECEAVLLIDAENAFNRLNRETALLNIKQNCPTMYGYLHNSYKSPSKLYLADGSYILSKEGTTQGDNAAMPMYALGVRPLIDKLALYHPEILQAWFADDGTAAGKIEQLRKFWDLLCKIGPRYGYFPNAKKSVLIVKNSVDKPAATCIFKGSKVIIDCDGQRHLGAVLGSDEFREKYVMEKVSKWVKDVQKLAQYAVEEPHAAHSAITKGLSCRWTYLQRTMPNISTLFEPLEMALRDDLIPSLIGRPVSDIERRILALPFRYGGLGIRNPVKTADEEFHASTVITQQLTEMLLAQNQDVRQIDKEKVRDSKLRISTLKKETLESELNELMEILSDDQNRYITAAREKGASSWLSALPIQSLGYALNKCEFRDAVRLRYGWSISDMPKFCACGKPNSLDHSLDCKLGGYVHMRHNAIRDTEARIMREVANDVRIEPPLQPIMDSSHLKTGTIVADGARLDVSARGIFGGYERTFFDVRVANPNAPSNQDKKLTDVYKKHENEKMSKYNDRVLQIEKSSFVPLVFTTSGGMGPQCEAVHRRIAEAIAEKRNEKYSHVMSHIRTRLRFALLKTVLIAIRGFRGKKNFNQEQELNNVSFNLIPFVPAYEGY